MRPYTPPHLTRYGTASALTGAYNPNAGTADSIFFSGGPTHGTGSADYCVAYTEEDIADRCRGFAPWHRIIKF